VLYHYAYTPPTASAGRQLYETDDSDHESDSDNNDDNELMSLDEDGPEEVGLPVLAVVTRVFANRYATCNHVQNRIVNIRPAVGEIVATQSVVPHRVGSQLKITRDKGKVRSFP
jgi:hypothetical protein